jgi:1,4-dihydroxy-2-naphthoyl-CoA hydrolase
MVDDAMGPVPGPRATPSASGDALAEELTDMLTGRLPGLLGMRIEEASQRLVVGAVTIREELLAPNGYLHAATVVGLADTTCGIGTRLSLPPGAAGFTTVELKTNYLGTARAGEVTATAQPVHNGRRTQIWDATVRAESGRTMALFRCTQMLLYP